MGSTGTESKPAPVIPILIAMAAGALVGAGTAASGDVAAYINAAERNAEIVKNPEVFEQ